MTTTRVLVDTFERVRDAVHPAVNGLSADELAFRPDDESNSIAWLAWHLARVQDEAVAGLAGTEPVWTADGWYERFGLPFDPADTGFGHDARAVASVVADARSLLDYFEDVHRRTVEYVGSLTAADLARVVDGALEPPETVESALVTAAVDDLQHVGQAAYVRGIVQRHAGD